MRRNRTEKTLYRTKMLKGLLAKKITLLRVFGYESRAINILADTCGYEGIHVQKGSVLYERLKEIRKFADTFDFNDNKIVIQVNVGTDYCYGNCLFIGYWDDCISIGTALVPNEYKPKEFPTNNGWNGMTVTF